MPPGTSHLQATPHKRRSTIAQLVTPLCVLVLWVAWPILGTGGPSHLESGVYYPDPLNVRASQSSTLLVLDLQHCQAELRTAATQVSLKLKPPTRDPNTQGQCAPDPGDEGFTSLSIFGPAQQLSGLAHHFDQLRASEIGHSLVLQGPYAGDRWTFLKLRALPTDTRAN